jgi:ATP-dependent DNA helicase PIF1
VTKRSVMEDLGPKAIKITSREQSIKTAKPSLKDHLSDDQQRAFEMLESGENVFLTGGAGSGKSYLVRCFREQVNPKTFPLLASTGAAAVIIGGRTFHSFFGLGIMDGGEAATLARVQNDQRAMKRISQVDGIIIDEISMIPSSALRVAEEVSRIARNSELPWGGMRVIAVGDFAQLPPVTKSGPREWCFQDSVWEKSGFLIAQLKHNQRLHENDFLDVLADVRAGVVTSRVREFLDAHLREDDSDDKSTRLFPRRDQSEFFNQKELAEIPKPEIRIASIYLGLEKHIEILKKNCPVPAELVLKEGCKVMFVQNDVQKRWVNGTQGTVIAIESDKIVVEKTSGRDVTVEKSQFAIQDAEGNVVASVINFPLQLAYATTIHKSQGATLDTLWVDLTRLWEPGHAYVALSRLSSSQGLKLLGWSPRSIIADPAVMKFYSEI